MLICCRKVVIDKGGIGAINGTRRVEQHRFKILMLRILVVFFPHAIQKQTQRGCYSAS